MFSRLGRAVCSVSVLRAFSGPNNIPLYGKTPFVHAFSSWWTSHPLAVVSSAAMSIGGQVPVGTHALLPLG